MVASPLPPLDESRPITHGQPGCLGWVSRTCKDEELRLNLCSHPDDDLKILLSRYPPSSTSSVTLHLDAHPPHHARFAPSQPSYSSDKKSQDPPKTTLTEAPQLGKVTSKDYVAAEDPAADLSKLNMNGDPPKKTQRKPTPSHASYAGDAIMAGLMGPPGPPKTMAQSIKSARSGAGSDVASIRSTRSRYGGGGEPMGDVIKKQWIDVSCCARAFLICSPLPADGCFSPSMASR